MKNMSRIALQVFLVIHEKVFEYAGDFGYNKKSKGAIS